MNLTNWQKHLSESKIHFRNANHLAYVTLTLLKENRLLIKIVMDLYKSSVSIIKAFLEYEVEKNKLRLSKDSYKNFNTFLEKISPKFLKKEDETNLVKILEIAKQHKDSHLEFVKRDKFVIFNNGSYEALTAESVKRLINSLSQVIGAFPGKSEGIKS